MKEYIPKIGETVRVIKDIKESSVIKTGRVGVATEVGNSENIWVRFKDGSGGLCAEVVPHAEIDWDSIEMVLIKYKASESTLEKSLADLEEFLFEMNSK